MPDWLMPYLGSLQGGILRISPRSCGLAVPAVELTHAFPPRRSSRCWAEAHVVGSTPALEAKDPGFGAGRGDLEVEPAPSG
jgi:hypothetical protein